MHAYFALLKETSDCQGLSGPSTLHSSYSYSNLWNAGLSLTMLCFFIFLRPKLQNQLLVFYHLLEVSLLFQTIENLLYNAQEFILTLSSYLCFSMLIWDFWWFLRHPCKWLLQRELYRWLSHLILQPFFCVLNISWVRI